MAILPKPYSILNVMGRARSTFQVRAHQKGEMTIRPRDGSGPKTIAVLRLHMTRLDKPSKATYYDLTSRVLHAQLDGFLALGQLAGRAVTISGQGRAPLKRYPLHIGAPA